MGYHGCIPSVMEMPQKKKKKKKRKIIRTCVFELYILFGLVICSKKMQMYKF